MKIRQGFVSNSSSQSFLVFGGPIPEEVSAVRLTPAMARNVLNYIIEDAKKHSKWRSRHLVNLEKIDPDKHPLYLTQFLADSGSYTDPLDDAGLHYWSYCDGSHGGPYDAEEFIKINNSMDEYDGVWILPAHYKQDLGGPKGQLELPFFEEIPKIEWETVKDEWDE